MSDEAKRNLRNAIVFALADGKLTDEEKQFIDSLRVKLGVDAAEFQELLDAVRADRDRISLPRGGPEADEAIELLIQTAAADGEVSDKERRLLRKMADYVGMSPAQLDLRLDRQTTDAADDAEARRRVDEIYISFGTWDEAARRERVAALGAMGTPAVEPLLRVLESYRTPDGMADVLELKGLVVEQLGGLGDNRAVYYLAQQIDIGDIDDEITDAALRSAAAEALGKIVGQAFSRDREGVQAAREWWRGPGKLEYDSLTI